MRSITILLCGMLVLTSHVASADKGKKNKSGQAESMTGQDAAAVVTKVTMDGQCSNGWTSVGMSNASAHTVNVTVERVTTRRTGDNVTTQIVVLPPGKSELLGCEGEGGMGSATYKVVHRVAKATYLD